MATKNELKAALIAQGVENANLADAAFTMSDAQKEAWHNGAQDATAKALALVLDTDAGAAMELIMVAATEGSE